MRIRYFPRKRLDIRWRDFLIGYQCVLVDRAAETVAEEIDRLWAPERTLVALSVRSALDLYLQTAHWPPGSEVLISGMTIADMATVIKANGFVPVPFDLDLDTMGPDWAHASGLVTSRTKAILFAHLFGARVEMRSLEEFAERHQLDLLEDCAQAFTGLNDTGCAGADIAFFSFGPIKTATALGGGLARVKDPNRLRAMRQLQREYPLVPNAFFIQRLCRLAGMHFISIPFNYGLLVKLLTLMGINYDAFMLSQVRGFPGADLMPMLRRRPPGPLLAMLLHRLKTFSPGSIERRRRQGQRLLQSLPKSIKVPGRNADDHSFWVFPVMCPRREELIQHLRERGYDASDLTSTLAVIPPPPGREGTPELERLAEALVYLPFDGGLPEEGEAGLIAALREFGDL